MRKSTGLFLVAGIWELIRFVAVFLESAAAPAPIPNAHLNLLWLAGPALVLAALFFSSAYYPSRIRAYIPILRIGAVIAVIVDAAVVMTGSYDWAPPGAGASVIGGSRALFLLAFGILVVDLLVVSLLLTYRTSHKSSASDDRLSEELPEELPEYDPTDLDRAGDGKADD